MALQPRPTFSSEQRRPHSSAWVAACFCFFLLLYGFTSRADAQVTDEAATLASGVSLDTTGTLHIDELQWMQDIVNIGQRGIGGHLYSKYFPGNTYGSALLYRLAARQTDKPYIWGNSVFGYHELAPSDSGARVALRLNALLGAFGMAMLFMWAMRRFSLQTAVITVLLIGLGSDWWYQSRGFFSEVGAGAFAMAALCFADADRPYWASALLGVSLLFRPTNLIAVPIWLFSMRNTGRRALPSSVFMIISLGFLAYYNWLRFGSPANFGYGIESFKTAVPIGLVGVLFSPGRSLFFYSPILILMFTGGRRLYSKDKILALLVFGVAAAYVLMAASWHDWWGGKVWGSRLVTPIVPLLGVLIAAAVDHALHMPDRRLVFSIILLGIVGMGIQLLTLTQNPVTVLDSALKSGYVTDGQSIMSLSKNSLALQLRYLPGTNRCTLDAYSLRMLFSQCY